MYQMMARERNTRLKMNRWECSCFLTSGLTRGPQIQHISMARISSVSTVRQAEYDQLEGNEINIASNKHIAYMGCKMIYARVKGCKFGSKCCCVGQCQGKCRTMSRQAIYCIWVPYPEPIYMHKIWNSMSSGHKAQQHCLLFFLLRLLRETRHCQKAKISLLKIPNHSWNKFRTKLCKVKGTTQDV